MNRFEHRGTMILWTRSRELITYWANIFKGSRSYNMAAYIRCYPNKEKSRFSLIISNRNLPEVWVGGKGAQHIPVEEWERFIEHVQVPDEKDTVHYY